MRAHQLIRSRRTVREFERRPLPANLVERCLDAAVHAPNHGLTEPWRFALVGPRGREALAAAARTLDLAGGVPPALRAEPVLQSAAAIVAVLRRKDPRPEVAEADLLAMGAAIQNLILCAWDEGVGAAWLGGGLATAAGAGAILSLTEDEAPVAIIALGHPATVPPAPRRQRAQDLTRSTP